MDVTLLLLALMQTSTNSTGLTSFTNAVNDWIYAVVIGAGVFVLIIILVIYFAARAGASSSRRR